MAALEEGALLERFDDLHRQVYRVYGMGIDRDEIHRHLASSFAGEALTREYVEHFTTLVRMAREQTSIEVLRVDYEQVRLLERSHGMAKIDAALYESARIDGAGWFAEFRSITLPSLRYEIGVCLTVTIIAALAAFESLGASENAGATTALVRQIETMARERATDSPGLSRRAGAAA